MRAVAYQRAQIRRAITGAVFALLTACAPRTRKGWFRAMRAEADQIPSTREWMSWIAGCLRAAPNLAAPSRHWPLTRRRTIIAIVTLALAALLLAVALHPFGRQGPDSALGTELAGIVAAPDSPLSTDAARHLQSLWTPAGPHNPSFFSIPTSAGGTCILSTEGILAACSQPGTPAERSGTFTVVDDIEGGGRPAIVYGQTNATVVSVTIRIDGKAYRAGLSARFYLFELPDPTLAISKIEAVVFTLRDGRQVVRGPTA